MRTTFINTLINLAKTDERIFLITPDLGYSVLENFRDLFPNRFINCGISEANAIGVATGLALSGKIVYVYSIIPFVTMRPFEQIRVNLAYMHTNVRLVGVGAGLSYGQAGATHHAIEDIAIMRSLPNMSIFSPSDEKEVESLTNLSLNHNGAIYLRLGRYANCDTKSEGVVLGEPRFIFKNNGSKIAIIFTGNILDIALEVYKDLQLKNLQADLISLHSIKPCNKEAILKALENKQYIYTLEEHNIIGGIGSLIAEIIAESNLPKVRFKRFGINDAYSHYVGNQSHIRERFLLTKENITNNILNNWGGGQTKFSFTFSSLKAS